MLPADLAADVLELYRSFAGRLPRPSLRPGAWDLVVAGGLVVELDEELHFNRYRAETLATPWSQHLPWHQVYDDMCERFEGQCLRAGSWGKRWTNA